MACIHTELGEAEAARRLIGELSGDGFAVIARDNEYLFSLSLLSDAIHDLGDTGTAAVLYDLLAPHAHVNASNADELTTGSVSRPLGVLAATTGRWEGSIRHFEDALTHNDAMGARPWVAHTQHDYARALIARGSPGDEPRASELLSSCISGYRTLEMDAWVRKAAALRSET
jgi:hypothetical protein